MATIINSNVKCPGCQTVFRMEGKVGLFGTNWPSSGSCPKCRRAFLTKRDRKIMTTCPDCGKETEYDMLGAPYQSCPNCGKTRVTLRTEVSCIKCGQTMKVSAVDTQCKCENCFYVNDIQELIFGAKKSSQEVTDGDPELIRYDGATDDIIWKHEKNDFSLYSHVEAAPGMWTVIHFNGTTYPPFDSGMQLLNNSALKLKERLKELGKGNSAVVSMRLYFVRKRLMSRIFCPVEIESAEEGKVLRGVLKLEMSVSDAVRMLEYFGFPGKMTCSTILPDNQLNPGATDTMQPLVDSLRNWCHNFFVTEANRILASGTKIDRLFESTYSIEDAVRNLLNKRLEIMGLKCDFCEAQLNEPEVSETATMQQLENVTQQVIIEKLTRVVNCTIRWQAKTSVHTAGNALVTAEPKLTGACSFGIADIEKLSASPRGARWAAAIYSDTVEKDLKSITEDKINTNLQMILQGLINDRGIRIEEINIYRSHICEQLREEIDRRVWEFGLRVEDMSITEIEIEKSDILKDQNATDIDIIKNSNELKRQEAQADFEMRSRQIDNDKRVSVHSAEIDAEMQMERKDNAQLHERAANAEQVAKDEDTIDNIHHRRSIDALRRASDLRTTEMDISKEEALTDIHNQREVRLENEKDIDLERERNHRIADEDDRRAKDRELNDQQHKHEKEIRERDHLNDLDRRDLAAENDRRHMRDRAETDHYEAEIERKRIERGDREAEDEYLREKRLRDLNTDVEMENARIDVGERRKVLDEERDERLNERKRRDEEFRANAEEHKKNEDQRRDLERRERELELQLRKYEAECKENREREAYEERKRSDWVAIQKAKLENELRIELEKLENEREHIRSNAEYLKTKVENEFNERYRKENREWEEQREKTRADREEKEQSAAARLFEKLLDMKQFLASETIAADSSYNKDRAWVDALWVSGSKDKNLADKIEEFERKLGTSAQASVPTVNVNVNTGRHEGAVPQVETTDHMPSVPSKREDSAAGIKQPGLMD